METMETWADELVALGRLSGHALSPDGSWVAACVRALDDDAAKYVGGIYRIPLDGSGAQLLLTGRFDDRDPAFDAQGRLLFTSNRKADQAPDDEPDDKAKRQVFALDGDAITCLTEEPLGVVSFQTARNNDRLFVETRVWPDVPHEDQAAVDEDLRKGPSMLRYTRFPVRYWDEWLPETVCRFVLYADGARRDLTPYCQERLGGWDWHISDDGRALVHTTLVDRPDRLRVAGLVLVDVDRGTSQTLYAHADHDVREPRFSPDGAFIAASLDLRISGRAPGTTLVVVPVATGVPRDLTPDWDASPSVVGWTRDGGSVLASVSDRGHQRLYAVDPGTGEVRDLTGDGSVHEVAIGEDALVVSHSTLLHPPRLAAVALDEAGGALRAVPTGLDLDKSYDDLATVQSIEVPGDGGTPVQAFVLTPREGAHGGLLLWIHGGPIGAWSDGWHWRWNPLAAIAAGWTVLLPNPRGSTGFGQDFVQGIWGNTWGAACATDVLAVTEAVAAWPGIDSDRVVAMGGSFGGYMTNWLGTQTDRFAALVTHASLWDFRAFHGSTDAPVWWEQMLGLDPWADAEALERYNPRACADRWTTPTLILHGEKDYRVPIGEAIALFEALQHRGVHSELCVFPDENHWILKPRNVVAWYEAWIGFLGRVVG